MTRDGHAVLPPDYFRRLSAAEDAHWWYRGTRELARAVLGARFASSTRLLDAGCGTGGFLRWALDEERFEAAAGVDVSEQAVELARGRVPEADIRLAPVWELPYEDASFDLVSFNDVLQHLPETEVERSLSELRRVLEPGGALLVRTNGAFRARRERYDWRVYDLRTVRETLARARFQCDRLTYANLAGSLVALARGRAPRAPTVARDGIPAARRGALGEVADRLMRLEARYLARPGRGIPWGHTLLAVARHAGSP